MGPVIYVCKMYISSKIVKGYEVVSQISIILSYTSSTTAIDLLSQFLFIWNKIVNSSYIIGTDFFYWYNSILFDLLVGSNRT